MPKEEENVIYIGRKSLTVYVIATLSQFNRGAREVVIKARGKAISRAVDVFEVLKSKFMPDVQIVSFKTGTDRLPLKDEKGQEIEGREVGVSFLELTIRKVK